MVTLPVFYGAVTSGVKAAVFGGVTAALTTLVVWLWMAMKDAEWRRYAEEALRINMEDSQAKAEESQKSSEVAYKVTKVLLDNAREDLEVSNGVVDDLMNQINELSREAAKSKTKDALIESLKNRCENLNKEYHGKVFRRVTTSADVQKLTGE